MPGVSIEELEQFSVKELRRQAAVRNVPLQHIAAAVEKKDLINMIINARPITDQYAVGGLTKVHSAESIAYESTLPKQPKRKKKKSRSRSTISSSSSGKKRKKKRKGRSRSRRRRRSPDAAMKALPQIREAARALLTAQAPPNSAAALSMGSAVISGSGIGSKSLLAAGNSAPILIEDEAKAPSLADAGMAAAAALGFAVQQKPKQAALQGPAPGLRPSINAPLPPAPQQFSIATASLAQLAGRICVEYLCKASCALGANCPEAHITDPEEEMRIRARFKEQECHFGANCTRSFCLYRHPGEKVDNFAGLSMVSEGQQVLMKSSGSGLALDFK
mmetsp:Transcript_6071/g.13450  ORF Transcript_6071/g.13450 Transcript_6071/m.13450 type:complete len:333 (-) Transcript_6071:107-1105(-)